jgi:hypothetical protein
VEAYYTGISHAEEIMLSMGAVSTQLIAKKRMPAPAIPGKELSALLAGDKLIPIVHGTTYDELRNVSPLLASRSGLNF